MCYGKRLSNNSCCSCSAIYPALRKEQVEAGILFMDRLRKIELVQRSLGIRHKLKVHESTKAPDSHEELARILIGKWELEDELQAIEELLCEVRKANVAKKKAVFIEKDAPKREKPEGHLLSVVKVEEN